MYRNKRPVSTARPSAAGPVKIGKVLGASGKFELVAGGPSRQQVHALLNLGITQMPNSKEEAAQMIREQRDLQMGQRLGLEAIRREGAEAAQPTEAAGDDECLPAQDCDGPEEHLTMALRGMNMITRRRL